MALPAKLRSPLRAAVGPRKSANAFGALIEKVRFAADSPQEREGFEPLVPRERDGPRAIARVVSRRALSKLIYSRPQVWW